MSFGAYSTAALMRDAMEGITRDVLQRDRPRYRYATVDAVDEVKRRAYVTFSGELTPVPVRYGSLRPKAGALVRVDGVTGDRHVSDIVQGEYEVGGLSGNPFVLTADGQDDAIFRAESRMHAGLELYGDIDNASGEPGGAYVLLSQDGGAVEGVLAIVQSAGEDGRRGGSYTGTTSNSILLGHKHSSSIHFGTNGIVRMTLASGGNLTVLGNATVNGQVTVNSSSYRNHLRLERSGTGADVVELTPSTDGGGSLRILVDDTIALWVAPNSAEFNGNLNVGGSIVVSTSVTIDSNLVMPNVSGTSSMFVFGGTSITNAVGLISINDNYTTLYARGSAGSNGVKVRGSTGTGYNDLFRVETNGDVWMTTSGHFNAGVFNPHIGTSSGIRFSGDGFLTVGGRSDVILYVNRSNTGDLVEWRRAGTVRGTIYVNTSGASYNTTSDHRLKTDIEEFDNALELVSLLRPIAHRWVGDEEGMLHHGFLAHEAKSVLPYAVTGDKDAVDEEGKPKYQQMDHSKLVPLLAAAIQELTKQLKVLQMAQEAN